ncbi:MAG: ABC transporter ATP-binding protein [Pseudomonadota bacterium]
MTRAYDLTDVSYGYGNEPVLRIPRLEIGQGEIVGLVGPNGSGKTTLLHLLAFLETPQQGEIKFFGTRVREADTVSLRRRVSMLLQNPYLFRENVLANIVWGLRIRKVSRVDAEKAALKALEVVGLHGFAGRYARSLSGGESQRVALAAALALEPAVLLLDEPHNHMDREAVNRTEEIVVRLCAERGTTVIFTGHAIEKVQSVAHRVIHLRMGRIVPTGPDNLFRGAIKAQGLVFDTGRITVHLDDAVHQGELLAIDPSKIRIRLDAGPEAQGNPNTYAGTVVGLSYENGRVRAVVDAGERLNAFIDDEDALIRDLRLGLRINVFLEAGAASII